MREEYTSNKKALTSAIVYSVCFVIILIAGIAVIAVGGPSLVTVVAFIVVLLIAGYMVLDEFMFYKNFKVTLTDTEIIVKEEYGKVKKYDLFNSEIYITRLKAGPIIVLDNKRYFIYGKKVNNFEGLTSNLEHLGVLPREDIIKANMTNAERLKDAWGRGKNN